MFKRSIPAGRKSTALAAIITIAAFAPPGAQQQQPPARADKALNERVTAVLVDVVVRDKRGQPVADLSPSDFELFEDGVAQKIGSFTPIFVNAPTTAEPANPAPASTEA